ncbi:hypothetical protein D1872_184590 [compost metagenome]
MLCFTEGCLSYLFFRLFSSVHLFSFHQSFFRFLFGLLRLDKFQTLRFFLFPGRNAVLLMHLYTCSLLGKHECLPFMFHYRCLLFQLSYALPLSLQFIKSFIDGASAVIRFIMCSICFFGLRLTCFMYGSLPIMIGVLFIKPFYDLIKITIRLAQRFE